MAYDQALAEKASRETGVPLDIIERTIAAESSGDPKAVSPKGEAAGEGLMQLAEGTAHDEGVADRFDAGQNIMGGAKYLKAMYDRFGSWPLAAAAYVAGPETVKKAGGVPEHVRKYVEKVTGQMPNSATLQADPATDKAISQTLADEKAGMAQFNAAEDQVHNANADLVKRYDALSGEYHDTLQDLDKLEAQRPRAPQEEKLPQYQPPQVREPFKVLQQMLPMVLLFGSKAGRNKSLALMNMTTASLNGARSGNEDVRKQAHEDWKAALDGMIQQAQLDHEHYMDILADNNAAMSERLHKLEVFAAISQNDQLRAAAQSGDLKAVYDREAMLHTFLQNLLAIKANTLQSERLNVEMQYNRERLAIEGRNSDTAAAREKAYEKNIEMTNPLKRAQFAERLRQDVDKTPLGKAYANLDQYQHVVDNAAAKLAKGEKLGSQEQAAFLDAFTKIVTGGQAIRGFTLKLNMEHAGLADKAQVLANQLARGGPLSDRQEKEMIGVVHEYAKALAGEYQGAISRADDFAKRAGAIGDGESVAPFEVDPGKLDGQAGPAPGGWHIEPVH